MPPNSYTVSEIRKAGGRNPSISGYHIVVGFPSARCVAKIGRRLISRVRFPSPPSARLCGGVGKTTRNGAVPGSKKGNPIHGRGKNANESRSMRGRDNTVIIHDGHPEEYKIPSAYRLHRNEAKQVKRRDLLQKTNASCRCAPCVFLIVLIASGCAVLSCPAQSPW